MGIYLRPDDHAWYYGHKITKIHMNCARKFTFVSYTIIVENTVCLRVLVTAALNVR